MLECQLQADLYQQIKVTVTYEADGSVFVSVIPSLYFIHSGGSESNNWIK